MGIGISGLASGFNSTEYIEAVIKQESVPLTNLQNKVDVTKAYRDFFNAIKTKLNTLKDAAQALGDVGSFQAYASTSSNSTVLSATAGESAIAGDYVVEVTDLAKPKVSSIKTFTSGATFAETGTLKINGKSTLSINLADYSGTVDEALEAIAKKINSDSEVGVKASVIQTNTSGERKLVLTSTEPGEDNGFTIDAPNASWGLTSIQTASNAKIKVNGLDIVGSTNSLQNVIPGVTLSLTSTGTSTVKVSQDTSAIATKVETFVKAYNDVVTTIRNNTKKSDKNSDGSLSLTLMGDPMLRDLQSQLSSWMGTKVGNDSSAFQLFSQIGLEIDKGVTSSSLMTGTITFDKDLFTKKLKENPTAVENMFKGNTITSKAADGTDTTISFAQMFTNNLKKWTDSVDGLVTTKIKGYESEIAYVNEQITNMKARIAKREESLKRQYTNLEVVMSQLNSQKDWISSQFAALTKSSEK